MSTLREALGRASTNITAEISKDVSKQITAITEEAFQELQIYYGEFFQVLLDSIINSKVSGDSSGSPKFWQKPGVNPPIWEGLSERWIEQKQRSVDNPSAMDFYHGITYGIIKSQRRYGSKRKIRKAGSGRTRTGLNFEQFIEALSFSGRSKVEDYFGPMQIAYSLTRPDGKKIVAKTIDGVIQTIRGEKGRFISHLDGTKITVSISAFTKLNEASTEKAILAHMIAVGGYKEQWFKVTGGGQHYRAILTPLIAYYTKYLFDDILKNYFQ